MSRRRNEPQDHPSRTKRLLDRHRHRTAELRKYARKLQLELDAANAKLADWSRAAGASVLRIDQAKLYGQVREREGLSPAETCFVEHAAAKGYAVYRAGWPDFLCLHAERDQVFLVEVKSDRDRLRDSQIATFAGLEKAGVRVRIWRPGMDQPVPWRTFLTSTERDVGHEAGGQLLAEEGERLGLRHGGSADRSPAGRGRAAVE